MEYIGIILGAALFIAIAIYLWRGQARPPRRNIATAVTTIEPAGNHETQ